MNRLVYFAVPGRAEACRVALAMSGLEWEDVEIDGQKFAEMRENGELPWGMVPVLQTEKGTLAESSAILRFLGKLCGLVPEDNFQAAKVDEFLDGMGPLARALDTTFGISDVEERTNLRRALFEEGGDGARNLKILDDKIGESTTGWAAGTEDMSIADLKLFTELFALFSGNYDGIEVPVIQRYENLLQYHAKVANDSRMKNHYANISKEDIRWTFLPDAFSDQMVEG